MDPFEAKHWNQIQLVLWISTCDRSAVHQTADRSHQTRFLGLGDPEDDPQSGDFGDIIMRGIYDAAKRDVEYFLMPPEDAEERAIHELSTGKLQAWGRRNGKGPREAIPAEEWPGLEFHHTEMAAPLWPERACRPPHVGRPHDRNAPFWTDVIVEREAVLRILPDPLEEPAAGLPEAEAPAPSEPAP